MPLVRLPIFFIYIRLLGKTRFFCANNALCGGNGRALFRLEWKLIYAAWCKNGLVGRSASLPVFKKMMLMRLRMDLKPRPLTIAA